MKAWLVYSDSIAQIAICQVTNKVGCRRESCHCWYFLIPLHILVYVCNARLYNFYHQCYVWKSSLFEMEVPLGLENSKCVSHSFAQPTIKWLALIRPNQIFLSYEFLTPVYPYPRRCRLIISHHYLFYYLIGYTLSMGYALSICSTWSTSQVPVCSTNI